MKRLTLLVFILLVGCIAKNISPPPTLIPSSLSQKETVSAIISALKDASKVKVKVKRTKRRVGPFRIRYNTNKDWYYEGREKGIVYAGFHYENFYMRVRIQYNETQITFKIVESRNLKQSKNYIHKNALLWLGTLERDVRASLGAYDRKKIE